MFSKESFTFVLTGFLKTIPGYIFPNECNYISKLPATVRDTAGFEHLRFERTDKTLTLTKRTNYK